MSRLFRLDGRAAVVTGASAGLGLRFATVLAEAGATVFAAARRLERLEKLAADVPGVVPVACDVGSETDRERLVATALERAGRLDVLVNNAGIGGEPKALAETPQGFADVLAVNLVAPFHLASLFAAAPAAGDAIRSIVNVSSIIGMVSAYPLGGASYASSKAGVAGLTRELAGQWGKDGIRVNALAPGWFRTDMTEELFATERTSDWAARKTLLRRLGEPGELDGALLFLASDASAYMTGQTLVVDGGWTVA